MRRTLAALLLALALTAPARGHGEGTAPDTPLDAASRDFDQTHLDIEVTPDLDAGRIDGRVGIDLASLRDGLGTVRLHCEDTQVLGVVDGEGTPLAWRLEGGVLAVDLARALARGETARLVATYRATPTRGIYFHRPTEAAPDTPRLCYSQGQGSDNRRWFPCYDLPDDRFSWTLTATVPEVLQTVSNGVRAGSRTDGAGHRVDRWVFADRAPSYLVSLIVGPLETVTDRWGDVTLEYSAVPGHGEELRTALGQTPDMMGFYSTFLDAPYPWPRYAQTFVWDFVYGGMENVTATTLNMRALHLEAARPNYMSEGLVAHELAHMWFGDLLTCRTWDDIWLNEGFATYMTDLWFEHRYGREELLLRRRRQNRGYMDGTPDAAALDLKPSPRGDRPLELFGGKQYDRGAAILHMLRLELGDDLFRDAIRAYVGDFRDGPVRSEDLRRTVERVAGRDLGWFWSQWVYGAGYPVLEVRRSGLDLEIRQTQRRENGQGLFRLTVPVRLDADGGVLSCRVFGERHTFRLPAATEDDYVRVGVGGDLLARVHVEQEPAAWAAMLARDPDVTARLDAVEALDGTGATGTTALAAALAGDASWAVRQAAAEALGRRDADAAAGAALLAAAEDADPRVRETVLDALGRRTREEAGATVLARLRAETKDYPRASAARALGLLRVEGAADVLLGLLEAPSHGDVVRARALEGLRALGDPRGLDAARRLCAYRHGDAGTHAMRMTALDVVTALAPDDEATHDLLLELLDDPFPRMRAKAARALGIYGVRSARARLERAKTEDPNDGVRRAAEEALGKLAG